MSLLDDSEVQVLNIPTTLPEPGNLDDNTRSQNNLELLPPVGPSPMLDLPPSSHDPFYPVENDTDAFQGALDEFYYDPNSLVVDPFNWFPNYWNNSEGGRNQIWAP